MGACTSVPLVHGLWGPGMSVPLVPGFIGAGASVPLVPWFVGSGTINDCNKLSTYCVDAA